MNKETLRELYVKAEGALVALRNSSLAWDRSVAGSGRFAVVAHHLDEIGRALDGQTAIDLNFVDKACDLRGLYWDEPKTQLERQALDAAAALFLRLRDELACPRER